MDVYCGCCPFEGNLYVILLIHPLRSQERAESESTSMYLASRKRSLGILGILAGGGSTLRGMEHLFCKTKSRLLVVSHNLEA